MDIKKLRGFRAVVISGSIAEAALTMHLSQSSMSRLISSLEDELRLTLFERRNRRVELTLEGAAFYAETERLLAGLDDIPRIINDIKSARVRRLRVMALPRVASSLVAPALERFMIENPEQRFAVDIRNRIDMERWVGSEYYDVGISVSLPCEHPSIRSIPLYASKAMVAVPKGHPLSGKAVVNAEQLSMYPIIGLAQGQAPRRHSDEIFNRAGLEVDYALETTSTPFAMAMVARGMGLFITDALGAANASDDRYALVSIHPTYELTFGAIFPRSQVRPIQVEQFIVHIKAYVRESFHAEQAWVLD